MSRFSFSDHGGDISNQIHFDDRINCIGTMVIIVSLLFDDLSGHSILFSFSVFFLFFCK